MTEMSGICLRGNEVVIVNDKDNLLSIYPFSNLSGLASLVIDLATLKGAPKDLKGQWEAVACKSDGSLVLLQESPARVLNVSKDLKSISSVHDLIIEGALSKTLNWHKDSNSLGEGIILGDSGSIIVVKEKDPVQLIEFSQDKKKKTAYKRKEKDFKGFVKGPLYAVNNWSLPISYLKKIKDVSDIFQHLDGSLYLLSDQSRNISRLIPGLSEKGGSFLVEKTWKLPKRIKKPEGFFLDKKNRAIIVVDSKKVRAKGNLFITSPLF